MKLFHKLLVSAVFAAPLSMALAANPVVEMKTSLGVIKLELNQEKAPKTVANFLSYVKSGQYANTIFHRVIPGFMVQGGGFTADMNEKPTRGPIQNEAANGLKNETGTIAMARTSDPHSASAQFFINVNNNDFLDYRSPDVRGYGYAVFGKVVSGMDVVNKIVAVPTADRGMHQNVPKSPIVIEEVKVISQ